ncbi:metalloregulator ArsR/SmtB family transcription factor [Solwaraspora sp. WMMD406]|uniref:ArsR/SmtB family transcription factor n=1 Tax=Solwaraspora sp. WMMD406 TaxID=3016095 RepID=UPI0024166004|nr:metalloregulator ArsR/SmtB family transcription factor [Solwaraspora sp. WMMD406]MDG4765017.1 metalloregulator ArsR/SmtB family transcription factor [Solwaraspora sp. WMMD406]
MIEYIATADDLAKLRFALSPVGEAVHSFRVLATPQRRHLHLPWARATLDKLRSVDFAPLNAVIPPSGYIPDFLTPAPGTEPPTFASELEIIRETPIAQFREQVEWLMVDQVTPESWRTANATLQQKMLDAPETGIRTLVRLLDTYWQLALAPCWSHLRTQLRLDVRSRMQVMENVGAAGVFSSLNERVRWTDNTLITNSSYEYRKELGGRGIVLVPSVFCGPKVLTMLPPLQPMIVYPKPWTASIFSHDAQQARPLAALIGGVRAAVLEALLAPTSTTELASEIGVTPGAVSQHLSVLRDCGLVSSRRVGRRVIYSHTPTGEVLVIQAAGSTADEVNSPIQS